MEFKRLRYFQVIFRAAIKISFVDKVKSRVFFFSDPDQTLKTTDNTKVKKSK